MSESGDSRGPNIFAFPQKKVEAKTENLPAQVRTRIIEGLTGMQIPLAYEPRAAEIALELSDLELAKTIVESAEVSLIKVLSVEVSEKTPQTPFPLGLFVMNLTSLSRAIEAVARLGADPSLEPIRATVERLTTRAKELLEATPSLPVEEPLSAPTGELKERFREIEEVTTALAERMGSINPPSKRDIEVAFMGMFLNPDAAQNAKVQYEAVKDFLPLMLADPKYVSSRYGLMLAQLIEEAESPEGIYEDLLTELSVNLVDKDISEENRVAVLAMIEHGLWQRSDRELPEETDEEKSKRRRILEYFWGELCARLDMRGAGALVTQTPAEFDIGGTNLHVSTALRYLYPGPDVRPAGDSHLVNELLAWYAFESKLFETDYRRLGHIAMHLYHASQAHNAHASQLYREIVDRIKERMHDRPDAREAYLILLAKTKQPLADVVTAQDWELLSNLAAEQGDAKLMLLADDLLAKTNVKSLDAAAVSWADVFTHYEDMAEFATS